MDGITTQELAQSRIHRMRWWTLAVVSVTVVLARIHRRTPMDGVRTAEGGG